MQLQRVELANIGHYYIAISVYQLLCDIKEIINLTY